MSEPPVYDKMNEAMANVSLDDVIDFLDGAESVEDWPDRLYLGAAREHLKRLRDETDRLQANSIGREALLEWLREQRAEAVDCHANAESDEWQAMGKGAASIIDEIIDHIVAMGTEATDEE